jgi:hypothetical protein
MPHRPLHIAARVAEGYGQLSPAVRRAALIERFGVKHDMPSIQDEGLIKE